jgi:hypothetical protein
MKSARMLIVLVAIGGLGMTGCMEPGFSIVPPQRTMRPGDVTGPNMPATQPDDEAAAARKAPADSGGEASNDPEVNSLAKQIDAIAQRPSAAGTDEATDAAGDSSADSAVAKPARQLPPPAPVAKRRATPAPVEKTAVPPSAEKEEPVSAVANVPSRDYPRAGAVTIDSAQAAEKSRASADIAASPTPRTTPLIQPSPVSSQSPAASANVGVEITDVRPVVNTTVASPSAAAASPNQPSQSDKTAPVNLNSVIDQVEQTVRQQPPNPEDELRLRLLYLAAGMDEKSAAPITGMDPVQAELLTAMVKTLASARQAMQQPQGQGNNTAALASVDELRRLLGQQSGVTIPRLALVTKVTSFGDYEAINPLRFKQGSEIHAYAYTEISNFRSEPVDGDRLRTLIGEQVQVFDASGKVVWERNESKIEDIVRTPRRDFFIPFPLRLPANLPAGDYVLKVSVEDRIGGTTDQQRLSFSIQ